MATILRTFNIEHAARLYRVEVVFDEHSRAPWEEMDTLGRVSPWTRDAKLPGQRVLAEDRGAFRYYDWQGAMKRARKLYDTGADAAEAVERELTYLRRWCRDDWHWCGVVVTPLTSRGDALESYSDSLWGIESDAETYQLEVAQDLAHIIEDGFQLNGEPAL